MTGKVQNFLGALRLSGRREGKRATHRVAPAESVTFIAALQPQDTYRAGLKQLEMAQGLALRGSVAEAGHCLGAAKAILSKREAAYH